MSRIECFDFNKNIYTVDGFSQKKKKVGRCVSLDKTLQELSVAEKAIQGLNFEKIMLLQRFTAELSSHLQAKVTRRYRLFSSLIIIFSRLFCVGQLGRLFSSERFFFTMPKKKKRAF